VHQQDAIDADAGQAQLADGAGPPLGQLRDAIAAAEVEVEIAIRYAIFRTFALAVLRLDSGFV
jgi:hypothetical protein